MGMHRSGTSFAASALRFLGVSLGAPERHMKPGGDNPAGYFELQSAMELNEELLAALGGAWDQPPVLDPGWEHAANLDPYRERVAQVLREAFGAELDGPSETILGFKDPRLSLLLPLWRTVVPVEKTLVLVRDPREVAASLASRRYTVAAPQAASLWLRYLFAAVASDPHHLLVRYHDFHDDLQGTMTKIADHLGVAHPDATALGAVRENLDPSLRHHDARDDGRADIDPMTAIALDVWNEGAVRLEALPATVRDAFGRGWLRPPIDGELLARARAEAVRLRETLRARNRQDALRAQQ